MTCGKGRAALAMTRKVGDCHGGSATCNSLAAADRENALGVGRLPRLAGKPRNDWGERDCHGGSATCNSLAAADRENALGVGRLPRRRCRLAMTHEKRGAHRLLADRRSSVRLSLVVEPRHRRSNPRPLSYKKKHPQRVLFCNWRRRRD